MSGEHGDRPIAPPVDYRALVMPILVAFGAGFAIGVFAPVAGFFVWVGLTGASLAVGVAVLNARAKRALHAAPAMPELPEARVVVRSHSHDHAS